MKKYLRGYRSQRKEKSKQLAQELIILQKPTEQNLTKLIMDAEGSKEKLLTLYREHLRKEADILEIPGVTESPYYLWVQAEKQIRDALFNIILKRSENLLGGIE